MENRFWAKVHKRGPDECWPWTGARTKHGYGYGILVVEGKGRGAHRISWCLANNRNLASLRPADFILHSCDNPPCVNPAHLRLGDAIDNNNDCTDRQRRAWGERNPSAKLTDDAVRHIRKLAVTFDGVCEAMRIYKVSQTTIKDVVSPAPARSWNHVK